MHGNIYIYKGCGGCIVSVQLLNIALLTNFKDISAIICPIHIYDTVSHGKIIWMDSSSMGMY